VGEVEEVRADVRTRLDAQRLEIEQAIVVRVVNVSSPARADDGEYAGHLRKVVSVGVGYGLTGVEDSEDRSVPVPVALSAQARRAARGGIALDAVLRGYCAAYALFCDFVMRAAEEGVSLPGDSLRQLLHAQAALFERALVSVAEEYVRESRNRRRPPEGRQIESVRKLLAGEHVDTADLAYEFDDWHVGAIARGEGALSALRELAETADRRLLLVRPERETSWAWFGGRRRIAMAEVARRASLDGRGHALVALGEPARGIEGWRLTHQQAGAAFRMARHDGESVVRYADVGLLASISQDHLLASSLRQLYLVPLAGGRDGGAGLRETLRAYFTAGRNVTSAASALGVSRQTVSNRLRAIEEKLGRTLESCATEIEVALRLEGIGEEAGARPASLLPFQH